MLNLKVCIRTGIFILIKAAFFHSEGYNVRTQQKAFPDTNCALSAGMTEFSPLPQDNRKQTWKRWAKPAFLFCLSRQTDIFSKNSQGESTEIIIIIIIIIIQQKLLASNNTKIPDEPQQMQIRAKLLSIIARIFFDESSNSPHSYNENKRNWHDFKFGPETKMILKFLRGPQTSKRKASSSSLCCQPVYVERSLRPSNVF